MVFASNFQDALDIAADTGKLDRFRVAKADLSDYIPSGKDEEEGLDYLGNACEHFDIESLGVEEFANPPFSFCALYNAQS